MSENLDKVGFGLEIAGAVLSTTMLGSPLQMLGELIGDWNEKVGSGDSNDGQNGPTDGNAAAQSAAVASDGAPQFS